MSIYSSDACVSKNIAEKKDPILFNILGLLKDALAVSLKVMLYILLIQIAHFSNFCKKNSGIYSKEQLYKNVVAFFSILM